MVYLFYLASFASFFGGGVLAELFTWDLGDFNPLYWGLSFLALGHFANGGVAWFKGQV